MCQTCSPREAYSSLSSLSEIDLKSVAEKLDLGRSRGRVPASELLFPKNVRGPHARQQDPNIFYRCSVFPNHHQLRRHRAGANHLSTTYCCGLSVLEDL